MGTELPLSALTMAVQRQRSLVRAHLPIRLRVTRRVQPTQRRAAANLDYGTSTAQWHTEGAARRPKAEQSRYQRAYVEERPSGKIISHGGVGFCRHGRDMAGPGLFTARARAGRRRLGSPQQIVRRLVSAMLEPPSGAFVEGCPVRPHRRRRFPVCAARERQAARIVRMIRGRL
jgi:hypothetical protein